ncbi:MAG: VOC family protein [Candidatus Thorarchaeota archaeon]|jgi:predicted enzyme related to lactoylglutathione lyase
MSRVDYFELPVDDHERASKFYETVFGWRVEKTDRAGGPYYAVMTSNDDTPGINGSLYKKQDDWVTVINIINSNEIDEHIKKIQDRDGVITFAKCPIDGVGYLAYFRDPDGNHFGMMQRDPSVKGEL